MTALQSLRTGLFEDSSRCHQLQSLTIIPRDEAGDGRQPQGSSHGENVARISMALAKPTISGRREDRERALLDTQLFAEDKA